MGILSKIRNSFFQRQNDEFERICLAIPNMSEEELDRIHDKLLPYVEEMPFSVVLPGSIYSSEEVEKRYKAFCQKLLPNGMVYGCRTYGEAQEMNELAVKCLDEFYKARKNEE